MTKQKKSLKISGLSVFMEPTGLSSNYLEEDLINIRKLKQILLFSTTF